jgi:hypothetical protein
MPAMEFLLQAGSNPYGIGMAVAVWPTRKTMPCRNLLFGSRTHQPARSCSACERERTSNRPFVVEWQSHCLRRNVKVRRVDTKVLRGNVRLSLF